MDIELNESLRRDENGPSFFKDFSKDRKDVKRQKQIADGIKSSASKRSANIPPKKG